MRILLISVALILHVLIASKASAAEYSVKDLVAAMPPDTETVIGARNLSEALPGENKESICLAMPLYPAACSEGASEAGSLENLTCKSVTSLVQGFKFIRPTFRDHLQLELCAIYLLKSEGLPALKVHLTEHARLEPDSSGLSTWCCKLTTDLLVYFRFVEDRVLIVATKKTTILEIAENLRRKRTGILNQLPEMQDVDLQSNYFAVRHYQKQQNCLYWSDCDLSFVQDKDVIGFSVTSSSLGWDNVKVIYYSRFPSTFEEYLKKVQNQPDGLSKNSFKYQVLSHGKNSASFTVTADSADAKVRVQFILPLLFGFVPI